MLYSKTTEYAIRALSYLASKEDKAPATIMEVNKETGVPQAYIAKIFQCLVRAGILESRSGPGGGYYLRVDAAKLTVLRIMQAVDDVSESPLSNCMMGQAQCNDKNPCSVHHIWKKARQEMYEKLAVETILDVVKMKNGSYWNKKKRVVLSKRMQGVFGY